MQALELTDIKSFMNQFLKSDVFDHFLLQEAVITSAVSFVTDGRINKGFYSEEELSALGLSGCTFLPFGMLRGNFFDLIKGKKTPSYFKFILLLSPENLRRTLDSISSSFSENDITGVFINIRYQNQMLTLTTGISYRIFSPDKSLDNEWDRLVRQFLKQHEIPFVEL